MPPEYLDLDFPLKLDSRKIKDPIHKLIPVSPLACSIIDTPHFQRLRCVKQLGTSYYVFAGASHNRFEHSLGVGFLSRLVVERLRLLQPELCISYRDVNCVELAGFCHDLGHGPLSHVWDGHFMPQSKLDDRALSWTHEQGSEFVLRHLLKENEIAISPEDLSFILALIAGDPTKCILDEKPFLFDIVSNKRNGLDVDKFDYLLRDCYTIGDIKTISLERILASARVIRNQICYDIKDIESVWEICSTRYSLHSKIYNHKTAKGIEYMFVDAFLKADKILKLSTRVFNAREYLTLTDEYVRMQIECSDDPGLEESRQILRRIPKRDLYKRVHTMRVPWEFKAKLQDAVTPRAIFDAIIDGKLFPDNLKDAREKDKQVLVTDLHPDHIIVDITRLHHGMGNRCPLDFFKWYSKAKPNACLTAKNGTHTGMLPAAFAEVVANIFTKEPHFFGVIQAGYIEVMKKLGHPFDTTLPQDEETDEESDPPTAPPSTSASGNASMTDVTGYASDTPSIHAVNPFYHVSRDWFPPSPHSTRKRKASASTDSDELPVPVPKKRAPLDD
ncbi:hypothetical protein C8J56DRAFT_456033 [Mycena floridula]|nr:hypothetical protein C8J56DRAFT_456033 [Mycena floridula]